MPSRGALRFLQENAIVPRLVVRDQLLQWIPSEQFFHSTPRRERVADLEAEPVVKPCARAHGAACRLESDTGVIGVDVRPAARAHQVVDDFGEREVVHAVVPADAVEDEMKLAVEDLVRVIHVTQCKFDIDL